MHLTDLRLWALTGLLTVSGITYGSDRVHRPFSIESLRLKGPELQKMCGSSDCRHVSIRLDSRALEETLRTAPLESSQREPALLAVPLPDGEMLTFRLVESPVLSPEMAAKYPDIKTYRGDVAGDSSALLRVDFSPAGFRAIVLAKGLTSMIDPVPGAAGWYLSYSAAFTAPLRCELNKAISLNSTQRAAQGLNLDFPVSSGRLRVYRAAILATASYADAAGGGEQLTTARIASDINRTNAIYERDLGVRLQLAGTVVVTDPANAPYTAQAEDSASALAEAALNILPQRIGADKFDVGEGFSAQGGGGVAALASVCDHDSKAAGSSLGMATVTPVHWINLIAHEFGHQFGANHTFNAENVGGCKKASRNAGTAFEPGAGTTTMSYAALCTDDNSVQDLQPSEDLIFHSYSIKEMLDFVNSGSGKACAVSPSSDKQNSAPKVTAVDRVVVPARTPFVLDASATDPDSEDVGRLTYSWEELDAGAANPGNEDDGSRPLFRTYMPVNTGRRYFPSQQFVLNNGNDVPEFYSAPSGPLADGGSVAETRRYRVGEVLPTASRTLRFRVTVRDNRKSDGVVAAALGFADTLVQVAADAGPFRVTTPNTNDVVWNAGQTATVAWDVAGTNNPPVNTQNVRILLSTDGGLSFNVVLAETVPNTGSATVNVPSGITTAHARVMIEPVGSVYYDISDADFSIQ